MLLPSSMVPPSNASPPASTPPPSPTPSTVAQASAPALPPLADPQETRTFRFTDRIPPDLAQVATALGVTVHVDTQSRSCVMRGTVPALIQAQQALQQIDMMADSCHARTWAVYVDRSVGTGWDLTAAIQSITSSDFGLNIGAGKATLTLDGDKVAAALAVIADGSSVDVLQRPHLALTHGQDAEVEAASEVPLPTVSVSGNGVSQSGVTYRKVGLSLKIKPEFLGRNRVRLQVDQSNGLIGSTVELGGGLTAPVIETQRVSSTVEIAIGETVVLGGVASDRLVAKKGILRDTQERQRGFLYVILSTSPSAPKALLLESPFPAVPQTLSTPDADRFLDGEFPMCLPDKGWERQEAELIRGKIHKR